MSQTWYQEAMFYHIYPLGLCGAPQRNDFSSAPVARLARLYEWADHIAALNLNAVYLGPVFESTAHGYDTVDYFRVDRRLGEKTQLQELIRRFKDRGLQVVLDGVFNHVGRDFWAFRDLRQRGPGSQYASWFHGLDFSRRSPLGDPFTYQGWQGHSDLVKLNLADPEVRRHLFQAVGMWIEELGITGLRLDAADQIEPDFLRALAAYCKGIRPDFWLMGEVVAGDYRLWLNDAHLDSVTNYECYKGLYSSHLDENYFEIAYSLRRQFAQEGIYRGRLLYNFADNHDVNRVASSLSEESHLYPLYILLFAMPGLPSVYYGSEWGMRGKKTRGSDAPLRPTLELSRAAEQSPHPDLAGVIARLAAIRRRLPALRHGNYAEAFVASRQLAFRRQSEDSSVLVAVNSDAVPAAVPLQPGSYEDALNRGELVEVGPDQPEVTVPPRWGRILVSRGEH